MACDLPTTFLHVNNIGDTLLMSELEINMKSFLDWAFLGIGAWVDTSLATNIYGSTLNQLRLVDDPSYTLGQVWESPIKDWVWETGVEYHNGTGVQPIQISGVYVNDTLYGTGDVSFGHYYNYPLGRVIFTSPLSTNSDVQLNYSRRWAQTYIADNAPWWRELQSKAFDMGTQFGQVGSGDWSIGAHHRVQLPAIVLECVARGSSRPYEVGNHTLILEQDMVYHVVAETRADRNKIVDILRAQTDRGLVLFNSVEMSKSGIYPLDFDGMIKPNPVMYPDWVGGYEWKTCRLTNTVISEVESWHGALHEGTVRSTFEVIIGTF